MNLDAIRGEDEILRGLRAAQERIRDPKNWCQGELARRSDGRGVQGDDPQAVQWCAVEAWALQGYSREAKRHLNAAAYEMGYALVSSLNNSTDHPTVMALFDRAQELRLADMMEATVA